MLVAVSIAPDSQTSPAVHAALGHEILEEKAACLHADLRAHDDFDGFAHALELRAGARLNEPKRSVCRVAFESHPAGVRRLAEAALERAERNAVGLFVRMVEDGDH